jgi:voltage-gated potassium channel
MQKRIDALANPILVCGAGTTGVHVVAELVATETPLVVIDRDEARLQRIQDEHGEDKVHFVVGDATDDDVLKRAGIERCRGVVAAITDDKSNLFVAVTARALNAKARIVAKAVEHSAEGKLRRAGADAVVSTNFIGGMRLVSEMIRPRVTEFLDQMLRDKEQNLRIEEVTIPEASPLCGLALRDTAIRKVSDVLVLAIREVTGSIRHNPRPDTEITAGMTLIILGRTKDANLLREGITDGSVGKA